MDSRRDWPARTIAALALILGARYLVWRVDLTMSGVWLLFVLGPPVRLLDETTVNGDAAQGVARRLGLGRRIEIAA